MAGNTTDKPKKATTWQEYADFLMARKESGCEILAHDGNVWISQNFKIKPSEVAELRRMFNKEINKLSESKIRQCTDAERERYNGPIEVHLKPVLEHVDPKSLTRAMRVCRYWHDVIVENENVLWCAMYLRECSKLPVKLDPKKPNLPMKEIYKRDFMPLDTNKIAISNPSFQLAGLNYITIPCSGTPFIVGKRGVQSVIVVCTKQAFVIVKPSLHQSPRETMESVQIVYTNLTQAGL